MGNTHNADFGFDLERENSDFAKQSLTNKSLANKSLKYTTTFWFVTTLIGQWFFFYYIMGFYGVSVINDNMEYWNVVFERFGVTPYREGDSSGNIVFAAHAIGAGIVAFGGALQLIPKIRNNFPKFHKFNGYAYLTTVFCLALSGFYLVWIRNPEPIGLSEIGTTINGFLILSFAYLTVRLAIKREIATHRKWAMRLFFVSNAQYTLRLGTFSYLVTGNMLGMNPAFGDPFFYMWTFGCYVLPLIVLQLYFYANEKRVNSVKYITSGLLFVITILMILGMVGYTPFLLNIVSGEPISL
ncbi:DUF2306 domain-containing protein [Thalassotalea sp. M1531]|uniref:DUF2306 domain-containing protein n=1 Tax=Thalassotalea algicola TaxID=2716224 RepID=A0A7Y0LDY2_9GAMM|nr:DUF2306 domain-containing protein [Thalassotalea algicola]NMP32784.1 DUF2306 domain-containing protein [Thalassotalea algicola]